MSTTSRRERRLQQELDEMQQGNFLFFLDVRVDYDNPSKWHGLLVLDYPPYNEGAFKIVIDIPDKYPFLPPTIQFRTEIYHINVNKNGEPSLGLDAISKWWKPSIKIIEVLEILVEILKEQNEWIWHRTDLAEEYFKDKEKFFINAQEFTRQFSERRSTDSCSQVFSPISYLARKGKIEQRIRGELQKLINANIECLKEIQVHAATIRKWQLLIVPTFPPYNNGAFRIEIIFPALYPYGASPRIFFRTPIFHPLVDADGLLHGKNYRKVTVAIRELQNVFLLRNPVGSHKCRETKHFYRRKVYDNYYQLFKTAAEFTKIFSENRPSDNGFDKTKPREVIEMRLQKELQDIKKVNMKSVQNIQIEGTNIWKWHGLIVPNCHPYNKGAFKIKIEFPDMYPFQPPVIHFLTKIYHPNIHRGRVDMEITCSAWYFETSMIQVIKYLLDILRKPDRKHFSSKLAYEYDKNHSKFIKTAEDFTEQFSETRPPDCDEIWSLKTAMTQTVQYLVPSWFQPDSQKVAKQEIIKKNNTEKPEGKCLPFEINTQTDTGADRVLHSDEPLYSIQKTSQIVRQVEVEKTGSEFMDKNGASKPSEKESSGLQSKYLPFEVSSGAITDAEYLYHQSELHNDPQDVVVKNSTKFTNESTEKRPSKHECHEPEGKCLPFSNS